MDAPDQSVSKRTFLKSIVIASTSAGLAGCSGGDDGGEGDGDDEPTDGTTDEEELGERVPSPLVIEWLQGLGAQTRVQENTVPILKESIEEALDIEVELKGLEAATQIGNVVGDTRSHDLAFWFNSNDPVRLDPDFITERLGAHTAGSSGAVNPPQYANCEHTYYAVNQRNATSMEERREMINKAQSIVSNDKVTIPLVPLMVFGATRSGEIEANGLGEQGLSSENTNPLIKSEPQGDLTEIATNALPASLERTNYATQASASAQAIWGGLVHSKLVEYDENFELHNVLAEDYTVKDDGERVVLELKDTEFHNGDRVTPEDVQFTFTQLGIDHHDSYPTASKPPYDSIEVVDDYTVEFNLTEPFPPLITRVWASWGIWHKKSWIEAGAKENPEEVEFDEDTLVGNGPFQVSSFAAGQHLALEPFENHPVYSPSHNLFLRVYRDTESAFQAFSSGEIQILRDAGPESYRRVEDNLSNEAEVHANNGFMTFLLYPQTPKEPVMFPEMRDAIGTSIDRKAISDVAMLGQAEPLLYACEFPPWHPWRPPEEMLHQYTDEPTGDPEAAREKLLDAGWGWDEDDNLRYPEGADTTPPWPAEETPDPEDFPCLNEDGSFDREY